VSVGSADAPPDLTTVAQQTAHHHHEHAPTPAPATGAAGSAAGSDEPADPRTHPNVAPASADCDEASCILEKYARECCARYKPAEMPAETVEKKPDGPPDTLDKNAVRAGIADVKPAVQQCGEDHSQKGTVKITLTVDASGRVTDATVSETPDAGLGTCVAKALERASFAKTQNGAVFTYPFVF
jgi:TonB family protein